MDAFSKHLSFLTDLSLDGHIASDKRGKKLGDGLRKKKKGGERGTWKHKSFDGTVQAILSPPTFFSITAT